MNEPTNPPPIDDDRIRAYVDGELPALQRALVEQSLQADAALASRVARERALRAQLQAAFDPVLDEPVPDHLSALLTAPRSAPGIAPVVDLGAARGRRAGWWQWGGMAACLVLGLWLGVWMGHDGDAASPFAPRGGHWVAQGPLAQALSTQLASAQPADAPARIGVSFVSREHRYCRSFAWQPGATAGLACREGDAWRVLAWSQAPAASASAASAASGENLRMAGTVWPAPVLKAIDDMIDGPALDARAEREATARDWQLR